MFFIQTCRTPSRDAQNFKRNSTDCEEIGDLHQGIMSYVQVQEWLYRIL